MTMKRGIITINENGAVTGKKVLPVGGSSKHALTEPVCRMGFIRHFIGFFLAA